MKGSSGRGLEVFDFREEDDLCESAQRKCLGKMKNPSSGSNPTLKFKFVENVSQREIVQEKDVSSIPCLDVDAVNSDHCCDNAIPHPPLETIEEKLATNKEYLESNAAPQLEFSSHDQQSDSKLGSHGSRSFLVQQDRRRSTTSLSSGKSQLHCTLAVSPSNDEQRDVISDGDGSQSDSLSSSASEIEEDDVSSDAYKLDHFLGFEMDDINMTVVLYPDYVVYRDSYCTEPQLTFSHSCIKFNGSAPSELCETFSSEWGVDDVVDIDCQWSQKAELVMIKLRVRSKVAEDDNTHGTTGIEELKIALVEPNWSQKQQRIACLNEKYMNVWVVQDMDMETDGEDSDRQRHHFPNFDEPFEDVVYPKGDSDAVSISKRDVDLLQPETFINDTIIDFYIKYLKNQIQAEEKHRFHFFNSFFFRKLADLDKDPSSIADGRAAFQRVRKWTRKVDLFDKDYIFIPINFNLHWSLIVICHLGEVPRLCDGDLGKSLKVPCILHMDSIKGTHAGLKNLIQSYLWEEWKERKKESSEEISSKFHNLRFVPLELPQQENSFDCGLFLLHYLELFLAEAPAYFSPFKITKFPNFLNPNWFPPSEASVKRTLIQRLISELLQNRHREASSATSSDKDQAKFPEFNDHETVVQSFSRCSPAITCQENISSSPAGRGIEMTLLSASSLRSSECVNDSGLVLRELFDPGATADSTFGPYQSFDQKSSCYHLNGAIASLEECTGTGDHFAFFPAGDSNFQQITGITSQTCGIPYTDKAYGAETSYDLGISAQVEHVNVESSPELSIRVSDHTEDMGTNKNHPVVENLVLSQQMDVDNCPPVENVACLTDGFVSAVGKMQNISINEHCEDTGTLENHPVVVEDLVPTQKMDVDNCPPLENAACLTNCLVSESGKMQNFSIIEGSEDRGTVEDWDPSQNEVNVSNCPSGGNGTCLQDDLVSASGKMQNASVIEGSEDIGTNECHPVVEDLVPSQIEVDVSDSPSVENGKEDLVSASCVPDDFASAPGKMQNAFRIEGSEDIGTNENHPLVRIGTKDLVSASRTMQKASSIEGSEDRGTNESHSVVEDLVRSQKEVAVNNCPSVEKVAFSTDGVVSASGEMHDAPIVQSSQAHDNVHFNNENPGIPNQDFGMVDTTVVSSDDVHKLDGGLVLESHGQQMAEGLLLPPPLEGEKCDDVQILDDGVPESQDQQAAKRLRLTRPLKGENGGDVGMLEDDPVPELQEQQAAKRLRLTPPQVEKCVT